MYFDYECPDCKEVKEVQHGMSENPDIICPKCQKKMTKVITGGTGFSLKGQGWYSTGQANIIKKKA